MSHSWLFVLTLLVTDNAETSNGLPISMSPLVLVMESPSAKAPKDDLHFDTDIVPVLTKNGCNSGACHGAAAGRAGFKLSLFGADPNADYAAIVHQFEGRRLNLAKPEISLLLRKPTGELNHEGGSPLLQDSKGKDRLLSWIQAGAKRGNHRKLIDLRVSAERETLETIPSTVALNVTATFDDQSSLDVTHWTVLTTSDSSAVTIDHQQRATISRRGQHVIMVRYLDRIVPVTILVPFSDKPVDHTSVARRNFVDDEILQVLQDLRIPVSPPASETQWLRRVTLDLAGRLPTPNEVEQFVSLESAQKKTQVVDQLLHSDEYVDVWTLRFSRLLRMHSLPNEPQSLKAYLQWLRDAIANDIGFDQVAAQLLSATGDSHAVGPANFGRMVPDARAHAELIGQAFAGVRLGCANCHNHPLDKWTQDDYHGLAAIFAPLDRSRNVSFTARGQVTNLRTGDPAIARIPGLRDVSIDEDGRKAVADWITGKPNLLLARATSNRLWRFLFGRGLVEPTDDLRDTNPSTHPVLLNRLAVEFAANSYRLRPLLRMIAISETYGRSDQPVSGNELDDRFYSHAMHRALEPEIYFDAISEVTDVHGSLEHPEITKAIQVVDAAKPVEELDVIGRCQRLNGCSEADTNTGGLPAQLHLLNGDLINKRLRAPNGRLQHLIAARKDIRDIVDEFYLRAVGRHATITELSAWESEISHSDPLEQQQRLEDFVWSLLNSREFRENH